MTLHFTESAKPAGPLAPPRADALTEARLAVLCDDPKLRDIDPTIVLWSHDALYSTDPAKALHSTDPDKLLALANKLAKKDAAWRVGKVPPSIVSYPETAAWIWAKPTVTFGTKEFECQACKTKTGLVEACKGVRLSLCPVRGKGDERGRRSRARRSR